MIIIDTTHAEYRLLLGTPDDDIIMFNGGPLTPGGDMLITIMGGGGDDVINTTPTFEAGIRYNIYGDYSAGTNPAHLRAPGGDHSVGAGDDVIHFGKGANQLKGGRSDMTDGDGMGDLYVEHGPVPKSYAPMMLWFDPHEGDKFAFTHDDVKRAGGGGLGYRIENIKAVAIGDDQVEFFQCYLGGFSKNALIDQQWVRFGVLDDRRGGHEAVILDRDPGDSVNQTVREWLWDHTGSGPDDFIL